MEDTAVRPDRAEEMRMRNEPDETPGPSANSGFLTWPFRSLASAFERATGLSAFRLAVPFYALALALEPYRVAKAWPGGSPRGLTALFSVPDEGFRGANWRALSFAENAPVSLLWAAAATLFIVAALATIPRDVEIAETTRGRATHAAIRDFLMTRLTLAVLALAAPTFLFVDACENGFDAYAVAHFSGFLSLILAIGLHRCASAPAVVGGSSRQSTQAR